MALCCRDHATAASEENGEDDGTAEHSELDHLLLSEGLRERVVRVWVDHGHNPADVSDHWGMVGTVDLFLDNNDEAVTTVDSASAVSTSKS